jgi:hypothetical protein
LAEAVKRLLGVQKSGGAGRVKGSFGVEVSLAVVGVPPRLKLRIPKSIETRKNFYGILHDSFEGRLTNSSMTHLSIKESTRYRITSAIRHPYGYS